MDESVKPPRVSRVYEIGQSSGPELRIVRLKGGQTLSAQIISSTFWGCVIHYDHVTRRSEPCIGTAEEMCPGCNVKKPKKHLFYLHVFSVVHGQCFLEMTETAMRSIKELLEGEETFRGHCLEFRRTAADNGRLQVRMSETMAPRKNLPVERDPEATLAYLWQWGRK